jgi:hypothetical protein
VLAPPSPRSLFDEVSTVQSTGATTSSPGDSAWIPEPSGREAPPPAHASAGERRLTGDPRHGCPLTVCLHLEDQRWPPSDVLASIGHWSCPPPMPWCPQARELGRISHVHASTRRCSRETACAVSLASIAYQRCASFGRAFMVYVHRGRRCPRGGDGGSCSRGPGSCRGIPGADVPPISASEAVGSRPLERTHRPPIPSFAL